MIVDALSNAAYRMSLHVPGAELEGGVHPPTPTPGRRLRRRAIKFQKGIEMQNFCTLHNSISEVFFTMQCSPVSMKTQQGTKTTQFFTYL